MMIVNVYKIETNNYDFHVVDASVIGFANLLKGWWWYRIHIKCTKDNSKLRSNTGSNLLRIFY